MTRPMQESRDKVAETQYATRQLQRRPSPVAPTPQIPFAIATVDNMSLSTGFTDVDFSSLNDVSDGTFWDLTTGDVRVLDDGFYVIEVTFSGFSTSAGVEAVFFSQINVASGSVGDWSAKQHSGSAQEVVSQDVLRISMATSTVAPVRNAQLKSYAVWSTGNTFPVVLRVQGYLEEDNVGVSSTPDVKLFIARLGSRYSG